MIAPEVSELKFIHKDGSNGVVALVNHLQL